MEHEARERFEAMFAEHFDVVLRFALARAEAEVAKDAAAETFLAAWRTFERVPPEPRGWLLAVCRRKVADDLVRRAFASLRPRDQEVLRLIAWDDLTPGQAAEVLACSTAIFSVRLSRARRRLRAALDLMDPSARTAPLAVGDAQ